MMDDFSILYEDRSVIVVNKPAGLATQSAGVSVSDCVSILKNYLRKTDRAVKGEPYIGVVHRLDQPVSGILVFAKDSKSAAALSKQLQDNLVNKHYRARVEGKVEGSDKNEKIRLVSHIYKDSKNSKAVIVSSKGRESGTAKLQEAVLEYSVEGYDPEDDSTLLDIDLKTGRFHQIRAQLSGIGHPIVGDRKYGSTRSYKGIALKAVSLRFIHPVTGKEMNFSIEE